MTGSELLVELSLLCLRHPEALRLEVVLAIRLTARPTEALTSGLGSVQVLDLGEAGLSRLALANELPDDSPLLQGPGGPDEPDQSPLSEAGPPAAD